MFAARSGAIMLPELYLSSNAGLKALRDAYISVDGTAARLQVVLDTGPYSPEAIAATKAIRATLSSAGFHAVVEGDSAVLLDLQQASNRDMTRAMIYVLGGIFIVLILLLRALVSPIYLILTILLSYSATMGVVQAGLRRHPGQRRHRVVGADVHVRDARGAGDGLQHLPHRAGQGGGGRPRDASRHPSGARPHGRHHHLGRHHHGRHLCQHDERQPVGAAPDRLRGRVRGAYWTRSSSGPPWSPPSSCCWAGGPGGRGAGRVARLSRRVRRASKR